MCDVKVARDVAGAASCPFFDSSHVNCAVPASRHLAIFAQGPKPSGCIYIPMAGEGPTLSAFAARKRLLARASAPKSSSTTEDENGGGAGAGDDAADDGSQRKRPPRRRKRQRVEATAGQGLEKKVTTGPGTAQEGTQGSSRSTPNPDVADETRPPAAETPLATAPRAGVDAAEGVGLSDRPTLESRGSGAVSETPAR